MLTVRQVLIFLGAALCSGMLTVFVWKSYLKPYIMSKPAEQLLESSSSYEAVDLDMPIAAFLKRCVDSSSLSMVKRLVVSKWLSSVQVDLAKLVVYIQGVNNFQELKNLLEMAMEKEGPKNSAISFVQGALKIVSEDPSLIDEADECIKKTMPQDIHMLRGNMVSAVASSKEYRKLKIEYRKALASWIDQNYGSLLDKIIART